MFSELMRLRVDFWDWEDSAEVVGGCGVVRIEGDLFTLKFLKEAWSWS